SYKISFLAPEGAEVQAGMPVVRFDTSQLEQQLMDTVAERDQAQTELDKRRIELQKTLRDQELRLAESRATLRRAELKIDVPEELASAKELFEAKVDHQVAAQEVASLEERLELERRAGEAELAALAEKRDRAAVRVQEIETYLERMTVRAPRAGTVIYEGDWQGTKVKIGDEVWQMRKVLQIPDLSSMEAEGRVEEADSGRLAVGQRVTLRLDAHPQVEYVGRVREIGKSVERRQRGAPVKEVELVIALESTDTERMRPGMRFQGEVEVERAEDVLLVPAEAVRSTAAGPVVYRRTLFGVEEVAIEAGRSNERFVEALSGVEAGARLAPPPKEGA
ncbi:MAG TPA: HlyD family efflux transporter periplasmic adaptor subunit, partial [Thermoanaerobaculia bacterium]|nr:HlyD family efflux transporter periplasmic adaptor subunit [Thermoanaerobaculia bacterium]